MGLVYLAVDPEQSLNLNDSRPLAFDYEVLQQDGNTGQQFASAVDERLTQWNLYAHVITGHNVADILAQIEEAAENLSELTFRRGRLGNWRSRSASCPSRGPAMVDTATDLADSDPDLRRTCASANVHSWYLDPTHDSPRLPITAALVSAVLVARSMGWCSWTRLDLDRLITVSTTGRL
ncbi:hypothetical protein [Nocardia abscessus]|uniref:hypothetical protein n=1 Tax=Nocardia abscessus TaxID=120957 RepID=UPI002455F1E7|nr:hypothetical protein [Nocardia abscessus]